MRVGKFFKGLAVFVSLAFVATSMSSCATVATGIEHANLAVQAKMSNTIFLNPVSLQNKTVFVDFKNTSQIPMPDLQQMVITDLQQKGYTVITDPSKANSAEFWLQGNVLYMGEQKQSMTLAGMLTGAVGGAALAGATIGEGYGKGGAALAGAAVGSLIGGLVGSAIHVDTYIGLVDIQIKQKVNGVVEKTVGSHIQNGSGTYNNSTYNTVSKYETFRTRIGVQATQTDLNLKKATPVIEGRLAQEIAGIF